MEKKEIERRLRKLLKGIAGQALYTFLPNAKEVEGDLVSVVSPTLKSLDDPDLYCEAIKQCSLLAQCIVSCFDGVSSWPAISDLPKVRFDELVEHLFEECQKGSVQRVEIDRAISLFEEKGQKLLATLILAILEDEDAEAIAEMITKKAPPKKDRQKVVN